MALRLKSHYSRTQIQASNMVFGPSRPTDSALSAHHTNRPPSLSLSRFSILHLGGGDPSDLVASPATAVSRTASPVSLLRLPTASSIQRFFHPGPRPRAGRHPPRFFTGERKQKEIGFFHRLLKVVSTSLR